MAHRKSKRANPSFRQPVKDFKVELNPCDTRKWDVFSSVPGKPPGDLSRRYLKRLQSWSPDTTLTSNRIKASPPWLMSLDWIGASRYTEHQYCINRAKPRELTVLIAAPLRTAQLYLQSLPYLHHNAPAGFSRSNEKSSC